MLLAAAALVGAPTLAAPPDSKPTDRKPTDARPADAKAKQNAGKVAGILIDKNDKWITVKADGEEEPVKYLVDTAADKKLAEAYKAVFNASRVQITYKSVGDERHLVGIQRQIGKRTGTVTGTVVKVHNDFWVEVKPKHAVADAYAPGANYNDKQFMALLRGLKPGDSVTIKYFTDFERRRIESLHKNADAPKGQSSPSATSPSDSAEKPN
jgi:hypothetical protein